MLKIILLFLSFLFLITPNTTHLSFGQTYDEKLEFSTNLEEILSHFKAIEQNLDDNNNELASTHALQPIDELYPLISPELQKQNSELDSKLHQILSNLKDKTTGDVSREEAQKSIDDAKDLIELVRGTIVGNESKTLDFKIKLIKNLLDKSERDYGDAISNGEIKDMIKFQDGSAFIWRSEQIYATIKSEMPEHDPERVADFYDNLNDAYDQKVTPDTVETLVDGITNELDIGAEGKNQETELNFYVDNTKTLLTDAKDQYSQGEPDKALDLVTTAYLDNFEKLEPIVGNQNPELNEEIKKILTIDLPDMIQTGAPESEVSAQVDKIIKKMDEVAVIVPEFGPMAFLVLGIAILVVLIVGVKQDNLVQQIKV